MIRNVRSQAIDQLSTKIRPKKTYKTNRTGWIWYYTYNIIGDELLLNFGAKFQR